MVHNGTEAHTKPKSQTRLTGGKGEEEPWEGLPGPQLQEFSGPRWLLEWIYRPHFPSKPLPFLLHSQTLTPLHTQALLPAHTGNTFPLWRIRSKSSAFLRLSICISPETPIPASTGAACQADLQGLSAPLVTRAPRNSLHHAQWHSGAFEAPRGSFQVKGGGCGLPMPRGKPPLHSGGTTGPDCTYHMG